MRALIVDDEPPARNLLLEYLEDIDQVEVIDTCGNGRDAIAAINEQVPDLVFLDVQMPGLDGFDVLEQIDVIPDIIFSTAYDQYAIGAFDAGAVDYLLKPYSRARFQKAMERVLSRHDTASDEYADRLATLLQKVRSNEESPDRLYVHHGERIIPVNPDDILWIEAAGDYSKLHTEEKTYLSSTGIGALAERLENKRFARVHRSSIIAFPAVDHLRSDGSGGYHAVLRDGTRVRISRSYAPDIRDRIL